MEYLKKAIELANSSYEPASPLASSLIEASMRSREKCLLSFSEIPMRDDGTSLWPLLLIDDQWVCLMEATNGLNGKYNKYVVCWDFYDAEDPKLSGIAIASIPDGYDGMMPSVLFQYLNLPDFRTMGMV